MFVNTLCLLLVVAFSYSSGTVFAPTSQQHDPLLEPLRQEHAKKYKKQQEELWEKWRTGQLPYGWQAEGGILPVRPFRGRGAQTMEDLKTVKESAALPWRQGFNRAEKKRSRSAGIQTLGELEKRKLANEEVDVALQWLKGQVGLLREKMKSYWKEVAASLVGLIPETRYELKHLLTCYTRHEDFIAAEVKLILDRRQNRYGVEELKLQKQRALREQHQQHLQLIKDSGLEEGAESMCQQRLAQLEELYKQREPEVERATKPWREYLQEIKREGYVFFREQLIQIAHIVACKSQIWLSLQGVAASRWEGHYFPEHRQRVAVALEKAGLKDNPEITEQYEIWLKQISVENVEIEKQFQARAQRALSDCLQEVENLLSGFPQEVGAPSGEELVKLFETQLLSVQKYENICTIERKQKDLDAKETERQFKVHDDDGIMHVQDRTGRLQPIFSRYGVDAARILDEQREEQTTRHRQAQLLYVKRYPENHPWICSAVLLATAVVVSCPKKVWGMVGSMLPAWMGEEISSLPVYPTRNSQLLPEVFA